MSKARSSRSGRGRKRRLAFIQVDVFTARALEGNQLAVFPDGRGLTDDEMQALAREMNLSETTFILRRSPAVERQRGIRVRIFTVEEELPFAGHPTLGTAFVLRKRGQREVALDLEVGRIPVRFRQQRDGLVFGEMRQRDPEMGSIHDRGAVARVAGLEADAIDPNLPIQTVSTGMAFAIVAL
ncbi:MAG TPA: PhzF family phenazine biosynthesis isomerase, partial [Terriglobales bacterium]|nr:PhzF family phenazine biosynthesis isomerase [Terriglobales bacterium]